MSRLLRWAYRIPPGWRRRLRRLPGSDRMRARIAGRPHVPTPKSGTLRPVVYLPTWVQWDSMRQRPQFLLQAFAALGHPVYFIDPTEPAPRIVDGVTIVPGLEQAPAGGVILYLHFAPLRHLIEAFDDAVVVYDILDDLSIYDADEVGMPEERRVRAHHPHVMDRADLVIVSNSVLADTHGTERSDLLLVPNGVDSSRFAAPVPRPADLSADGRPIVGYHGMVSYWFDFALMAEVARLRPDYRFLLVGPTDPRAEERAAALASLPNVEFLGERPSDSMPAYVQAFDVGTVWFEVNDLTRAVTPLKVYEYLAAGVPCVSTPLPACVAEPAVATAGTALEFAEAIDGALGTKPSGLEEAARRNDWVELLRPVVGRLEAEGLLRVP